VTEIEIRQQDIESLGQRFEDITHDNERALLAGILAIAAKAIRGGSAEDPPQVIHSTEPGSPIVVQLDESLPPFQDQIAAAFTPGVIVETDDMDVDDVRVGHLASIRVGHVASIKLGPGS
jgi:hypothetical protein